MELRRIEVSADAIVELVDLLPEGGSLDRFRAGFRVFVDRHGWDWFPLLPKHEFNHRARLLYIAFHSVRYAAMRLRQLEEGGSVFWVFRAGHCADHQILDGVTLPPTDEFWSVYLPPLAWECSCYVTRARSLRAVERLGGIVGKRPPADEVWIDPMWRGPVGPDLLTIIAAIIDGDIPPLP